jgi:ATP-dependent Clp protease ATP-binding subunit ClpB
MTSNLGSRFLAQRDTLGEDEIASKMKQSLREFFRPEFLNRVDEIVVFRFLSREDIARIVTLQLEKVNERLKENELQLEVSEDLIRVLADKGYDPEFGARPLKRLVRRMLLDPLASRLIKGDIPSGSVIRAHWNGEETVFDV